VKLERLPFSLIVGLLMLFVHSVQGQNNAFNEIQIANSAGKKGVLSLGVENDVFNSRDRYYTHGLMLRYDKVSKARGVLRFLLPGLKGNQHEIIGFSIDNRIYTPIEIFIDKGYIGDRPYAGYTMLGIDRTTYSKNKRSIVRTKVELGMLGPFSGSGQMQLGFHRISDNGIPRDWDSQIATDPLFDYELFASHRMLTNKFLKADILGSANIGTLFLKSGIGVGVTSKLFKFSGDLKDDHSISLSSNYSMSFIGFDATMQGGVFGTNKYKLSYNDINHVVHKAQFGITYKYKTFGVEFAEVYLSSDFKSGGDHLWGRIKLFYGF